MCIQVPLSFQSSMIVKRPSVTRIPSHGQDSRPRSPPPHILGQIVEMGFSSRKPRKHSQQGKMAKTYELFWKTWRATLPSPSLLPNVRGPPKGQKEREREREERELHVKKFFVHLSQQVHQNSVRIVSTFLPNNKSTPVDVGVS